jgi:hypothetical protein
MSTALKLQHLRQAIGAIEHVGPKEFWTAPNLSCGIPRGVVVELLGPKRTEWFIQFLKMHQDLKTFWAEKEQQVLPTAIQQRGVDLNRITFGVLGDDSVKSLRRVIQSQLFPVILAPNQFSEIKVFKAFQLFTEKSNSTLFLMGNRTASNAWPISLQLEIHPADKNQFQIEIIKQKHGKIL